jgi:alkanesulfonate monooxygenase SsuD/methylene tetrahydromethanopterin reductase-like flavin-dependent oxidoreductase (luciferase family)
MPKPKVIVQIYPMLPTADRAEREQRRPLGRDRDLYHDVLHDWLDIVKAADDLGVWGISTIEHHLHSEGYEVGPNPGVLNAWWASHVKQARVGSLGYVMATQDPIRVAEEVAILDHLTEGRFFCGVAPGYQ